MSFLFTKSPGTVLARPPSRNTSRQYLPARYNEALCFQPAAVRPSLSHNMKKGFHALKGMAKNLQHYPVFHTHTCAALQPTPCNGTPDAPPPHQSKVFEGMGGAVGRETFWRKFPFPPHSHPTYLLCP